MSQQEKLVGYKFNLLHEDVADKDLLEDQTHIHVSETIYQLIQSSAKGVTIGLEGSWGSGKSTVINLLRNKLKASSESSSLFFMFDAWAHDGDPLRRIFLESLIKEIDSSGEDGILNDISGKITGRKKTVTTESTKSASTFGKLLSICALTIPLGSAFMNKVDYSLINFSLPIGSNSIYWQFLIGLVLCGSPFIFIAFWAFFGERNKVTKKIRWDFFTTEATENSTQDITEDGERTSIEFEAHFEKIIIHAINAKKVDRVVVVIDNLDRVDPPHAKSIWSTLQTFFQKRSKHSKTTAEKWEDKLWFIIPFDREGFSKIWDKNSQDDTKSVPISFLKKCFQIIAEVPEPVMSAWPDYAKKTFAVALSEWPEKERFEALEAFIRFASHLDKSPTPRDIKVLANQIGLLGMRWGAVVSSEALCVYALYRQKLSETELRKALLKDGLPENYVGINDSKMLKMEIAGLLFGVMKEKGVQLLLAPEINGAIKNADGELLKELAIKHDEAFWITWRPNRSLFIPTDAHVEEHKIAATIAICNGLGEFKSKNNVDISLLTHLWKSAGARWEFKEFDYSLAIKSLIEISTDRDSLLAWLNQFIEAKLIEFVGSLKDNDFRASSLPNFKKLIETTEFFGLKIRRLHYHQLNAENWKTWNAALDDYDLEFSFVLPDKKVVSGIVENVVFDQATLNEENLNLLLHTLNIYPASSDWGDAADEMIKWGSSSSRLTGYDTFYLLLLRLIATQKNEIAEKIKACVKAEPFWVKAKLETTEDSIYLPVLAALSLGKKLNESTFVGSDCLDFWAEEKDDGTCTKIYNLISASKGLGSLWMLSTNLDNKLAIQLINNFSSPELFKSPYGTWYLDEYKWASHEQIQDIIDRLYVEGSVSLALPHMQTKLSAYGSVFRALKNHSALEVKKLIDKIIEAISIEQWSEYFSDENDLIYCVDKNNHKYSDALVQYFSGVVSEAGLECNLWPNFQELIDKCCDSHTIAMPKILNSYFEADNDYLNLDDLTYLLQASKDSINACDKHSLMQNVIAWFDDEEWEKISALLSLDLESIQSPLDGLVSRISPDIDSFSENIQLIISGLRAWLEYDPEKKQKETAIHY